MNTCPNCDVPGGVTVIADVPLRPSLVAVIVTGPPAATPLTSPLPFTLAIALLLDCQVTTRPVNGLPFASLGVAVSCTVLPTATPAVAGVTVTDATGTGVTVMAAVPFWPSLVAVIVAEPATLPVTSPVPVTVATDVLLLAHVTERPVRMLPLASRRVALSCTVWPAGTLADAGLTVTDATGTPLTVMLAVPLCPSLVAVIVTGPPAATPLTSPLPFTLAIALLLDCQVTTRPVNGLPFASLGVAVSCTVLPTATPAVAGVTVTDATGTGVTVMAAVPFWPSLVAVIVAEPATLPVTSPVPVTVATDVLLLAHVTERPVRMLPLASRRVAVSCTVWPAGTLADAGLTVTDATGTPLTVMLAVPLCPSLVAVIVTGPPAATPLTSPLPFTLAIALLLDCQVITRPVNGLPLASRGVAVSCTVCPIATVPELGVTVTAATGAPVTVTLAVPLCP